MVNKAVAEMTLDEYRESLRGQRIEHHYYNRYGQIKINHMNSVLGAFQLGKPIAREVVLSNSYLIHKGII